MSKILTEEQVLEKLNIQSFNQMKLQQIPEFYSLVPKMDADVAIHCIEQFPNFTSFSLEMVKQMSSEVDSLAEKNKDIQKTAIDAHKQIIHELSELLHRETISEKERQQITKTMQEEATKIDALARDHQKFILKVIKIVAIVAFFPIVVVAFLLFKSRKNSA